MSMARALWRIVSSVAGSESVKQTAPRVEEQMGLNGQETVDSGSGQDDSDGQGEGRADGRDEARGLFCFVLSGALFGFCSTPSSDCQ